MHERKTGARAFSEQYRRAGKKEKGKMLDDFVSAAGCSRSYAARMLRNHRRRRPANALLAVQRATVAAAVPAPAICGTLSGHEPALPAG
jgi:hypothetical protein